MKSNKRKTIAIALASALLLAALTACHLNVTATNTDTHTDANGNTTTTTTVTTNGKTTTTTTTETAASTASEETTAEESTEAAEETTAEETEEETEAETEAELIEADMLFENNSGVDIYELYFAESSADNWGDELLGGAAPMVDGESLNGTFRYHADSTLWDLRFVDADGNEIIFEQLDFSLAEDPEDVTISITADPESDGYLATIA